MEEVDLGDNHWLRFIGWHPDRKLNPQYKDIPDCDIVGANIRHLKSDGSECNGFVHFDIETVKQLFSQYERWTVESWNPLTLSPSILCEICGDHGFIKNGKWVKA